MSCDRCEEWCQLLQDAECLMNIDCPYCEIADLRRELEETREDKKRSLAFLEAQNKSLMEHIATCEQHKIPSYTLNPQLLQRAEQAESEAEALRAECERSKEDYVKLAEDIDYKLNIEPQAKLSAYENGVEVEGMVAWDVVSGGQAIYLVNELPDEYDGQRVRVLVMKEEQ